jgi:hypothetical protein
MENRDVFLSEFRGEVLGRISLQSSAEENFQNQTIRPILKLQNDLLIEVFKNYITESKSDFHHFTVEQKLTFIEQSIQRDIKFRNALKGIIVGLFTVEEYSRYIRNSAALNKRIMSLLIERFKNQVQLFESESTRHYLV